MNSANKIFSSGKFIILVWIVGILSVWELGAFILASGPKSAMAAQTLPYIHDIFRTIVVRFGLLIENLSTTLSRAALGFLLGAAVGFLLAVFMSLSGIVEKIAYPYLLVSQMIPILGLAPILMAIVRDVDATRILIAAFITFFPVSTNMLQGFKSVETNSLDLMRSYAAKESQVYMKLKLRHCMPYLFTGLKITAPMAVTASVLVDTLGGSSGIGYLITYSLYGGFPRTVFWASVFTSAVSGILSYQLIVLLEKLYSPHKSIFRRAFRELAGRVQMKISEMQAQKRKQRDMTTHLKSLTQMRGVKKMILRDYTMEFRNRVDFIRNIVASSGAQGIVYGNSGGKDSTLVGILCKMACENTVAVLMPCGTKRNLNEDLEDALATTARFSINTRTIDLTAVKDAMLKTINKDVKLTDNLIINIPPRLRITVLYSIAAAENLLVAGTGNRSEGYMGYFTKWGDGAYDFNPIADLTVTEIYEFLRFLKVPDNIIEKAPSAGLFEGQTDENEMGVTYAAIDDYILNGKATQKDKELIERYHRKSEHKRRMPIGYDYEAK
jgi:NAD+ synthase